MSDAALLDAFEQVRALLYHHPSEAKDAAALPALLELAHAKRYPAALHLLGQMYWEGIAVEPDLDRAFALVSEAVDAGHRPAMDSLASMHLVGAGCPRNFAEALRWHRRLRDESGTTTDLWQRVHIGAVGLDKYQFVDALEIELNDQRLVAEDALLERINLALLDLKGTAVRLQSEEIARNPGAYGNVGPRQLPCAGVSGPATASHLLCGEATIDHFGLRDGWSGATRLFPLRDFHGVGAPVGFDRLERISILASGSRSAELDGREIAAIRQAFARRARFDLRKELRRIAGRLGLSDRRFDQDGPIELSLIGHTLGCAVSLKYRGGWSLT